MSNCVFSEQLSHLKEAEMEVSVVPHSRSNLLPQTKHVDGPDGVVLCLAYANNGANNDSWSKEAPTGKHAPIADVWHPLDVPI